MSAKVQAKDLGQSKPKSKSKRRSVAARLRDRFLAPVHLNERTKPGPMASELKSRASDKGFLSIKSPDYLELVDWTGRQIRGGKRGRIPDKCKPILERLGLSRSVWCDLVRDFGRLFGRVAGRPESLRASAELSGVGQRRSSGGAGLLGGH